MIVYSILHKPSGKFMPQRMSRSGNRGWTHWQPGIEDGHVATPRLFNTHRVAAMALTAWLAGVWVRRTGYNDTMDGPDYYDDLGCELPKVERRREDMEIVKMILVPEEDNY